MHLVLNHQDILLVARGATCSFVLVVGQLPLASSAEPPGQVCDGGGRTFVGGATEVGGALPVERPPVLLEGEVSLQSILFPLESYSQV